MGQSRRRRSSNRNAKIFSSLIGVLVALSMILSLVGSCAGDLNPEPTPTFPQLPTWTPAGDPTLEPTATGGIPTPVIKTPTASP